MTRELLQQALDALESLNLRHEMSDYLFDDIESVRDMLRTELAKPEPEPVAWAIVDKVTGHIYEVTDIYQRAVNLTELKIQGYRGAEIRPAFLSPSHTKPS